MEVGDYGLVSKKMPHFALSKSYTWSNTTPDWGCAPSPVGYHP